MEGSLKSWLTCKVHAVVYLYVYGSGQCWEQSGGGVRDEENRTNSNTLYKERNISAFEPWPTLLVWIRATCTSRDI